MRTWKQLIPYLAGATLAIGVVGILRTPRVSAAIRATLVEVVIPTTPFVGSMLFSGSSTEPLQIGFDTGTLGVTNITVTNLGNSNQTAIIFAPVFNAGGKCSGPPSNVIGEFDSIYVNVPLGQTTTISYPSALTFPGTPARGCIGAVMYSGSGFMQVTVNGFVN